MSVKEIHSRLTKNQGISSTYQATHKTTQQLLEQRVLVQESKKFKLNLEWVKQLNDLTTNIEKAYNEKKHNLNEFKTEFEFENLRELYDWILDVLASDRLNYTHKNTGAVRFNHFYTWITVVFFAEAYLERIKKVATQNPDAYFIGNTNTFMDEYCAEFWRKLGWKVKIGIPTATEFDTFVQGDGILQMWFGDNLKKALDKTFSKIKSVEEINIPDLEKNILKLKTRIHVQFIKNHEIAQQLFEETKNWFK